MNNNIIIMRNLNILFYKNRILVENFPHFSDDHFSKKVCIIIDNQMINWKKKTVLPIVDINR